MHSIYTRAGPPVIVPSLDMRIVSEFGTSGSNTMDDTKYDPSEFTVLEDGIRHDPTGTTFHAHSGRPIHSATFSMEGAEDIESPPHMIEMAQMLWIRHVGSQEPELEWNDGQD